MWSDLLLLLTAGAAGGFVGGLVGVGGGIVFAPVLFFYYQGIGVAPDLLTPLTIGTSLMCTFVVAIFSAQAQLRKRSVLPATAIYVGFASALAAVLMTRLVTTHAWYDASVFQIVFGVLLLVVSVQMSRRDEAARRDVPQEEMKREEEPTARGPGSAAALAATGAAAGVVATAAGVGGGIVLVPIYRRLFGLPIHLAVGTSSATIVLIALGGAATYAFGPVDLQIEAFSVGFVDFGRAAVLSVPAAVTARLGVRAAHRLDRVRLNRAFAIIAAVVAARMLLRAVGLV